MIRHRPSALAFFFALTGAFLGAAKPVCAQLGAVTSVSRAGDRLDIGLGRDALTVRVRTADMIEVDYRPAGKSTPQTPCLTRTVWVPIAARFRTDTDPIVIYDRAGRLLVKEQNAEGVSLGGLKLTSTDLMHWKYQSILKLASDRVIDPCVRRCCINAEWSKIGDWPSQTDLCKKAIPNIVK